MSWKTVFILDPNTVRQTPTHCKATHISCNLGNRIHVVWYMATGVEPTLLGLKEKNGNRGRYLEGFPGL